MFGLFSSRPDSGKAHELVSQGALLLDVRTPEEHRDGHIPGSVNIPLQQLGQRMTEVGPKERSVVVYCRSGGRSASAASMLRAQGYEVLDLGPMSAW